MSPNRIACPECGAGLKSATGFQLGQSVNCLKCETAFTIEESTFVDSAAGKDEIGHERSYKNSWMRYAVLGVLLTTLVVLGYMLYEKKMKERESVREVDNTDKEPQPLTPRAKDGSPKLVPKLPSGGGGDPGPGTKKQ